MIDYRFYSTQNKKQLNLNLLSGLVPQDKMLSNAEQALAYQGAIFQIESTVFHSGDFNPQIYLDRVEKSLPSKVLVDYSYETGFPEKAYDEKILELLKLGIDTKDVMFVVNRSAYHEWMDKHIDKIIFIDFFAVSAVIRNVIYKTPVSNKQCIDRPNKLNFLVGKVNKESRKLLLKSFYNSHIKDKTIFSILGNVAGEDDKRFSKFIKQNQGPLDGAALLKTNEGVSSQGWGNSSHVYDSSSVSVVCETHEHNDSLFLTEKIYRPIINRHPFVIRAAFPALEYLNAIGFKTFGDFVDESYDKINTVSQEHADQIVEISIDLLDKVKNHPHEIQKIVDHNYETLIKFAQSELANLNQRLFASLN